MGGFWLEHILTSYELLVWKKIKLDEIFYDRGGNRSRKENLVKNKFYEKVYSIWTLTTG